MTTTYLAVAHVSDEFNVQAFSSRDAALRWLATENINDREWAAYVHAMRNSGSDAGLSTDRSTMAPEAVIEHWCGPKGEGEDFWGDGDISMQVLVQTVRD